MCDKMHYLLGTLLVIWWL